MNHLIPKLVLYRNLPKDSILLGFCEIFALAEEKQVDKDLLTSKVLKQINNLLKVSTDYAFDGNLWQNYLTFVLITNENPFSLTSEKLGAKNGSVNQFAKQDFELFRKLFNYDFSELEKVLNLNCFSVITNYVAIEKPELMYNKNVSIRVRELSEKLAKAKTTDEFFDLVTAFYRDYGVGMFGLNKAFRISQVDDKPLVFQPINNMEQVYLSDLIGYDLQKNSLLKTQKPLLRVEKLIMYFCLVIVVQVNLQALKPL